MELRSIKEILFNLKNNPNGDFYLPPNIDDWNLDTLGVFSEGMHCPLSNSTGDIPKQTIEGGWIKVIDNHLIEKITENAKSQLSHYTMNSLFSAFVFYVKTMVLLSFKTKYIIKGVIVK
ncbi:MULTISPECIES: DUF7716 domain-containing protein [Providencia]|uniref:DUF7716 domain-containing protein n=1 Tax=Providencia TaxID=586 RepID=UPI0024B0B23B